MTDADMQLSHGITVVVPFYNRASFARRLLASVIAQSQKPAALFFVDNGSSADEVAQLMTVINETDSQGIEIRYLACSRPGNANIARNHGMRSAGTTYVAFLDSDDWWEASHLKASLDVLRATNKAAVYGGAIVHNSIVYKNLSADVATLDSPFHLLFSKQGWSAQSSSYVVDKTRLCNVEWDETLRRHQDYDFFLAVERCAKGWAFHVEPSSNLERNDAIAGRTFDFKSMIKFLRKWKDSFPVDCQKIYLEGQMDLCLLADSPDRYYRYYRLHYLNLHANTVSSRIKSFKPVRRARRSLIDASKRLQLYSLLKKVRDRT